MDTQWLKTFCIAAETLNFRKTAERLMMSQPNVTVQIRQLEEHLGSPLFVRKNNRVTLSDTGRYFYPQAKQLLLNLEDSLSKVHSFSQGYRRHWNVAISPLMAETILPYVLRSFLKKNPDIEIGIRVEESADIEELVLSGEVNMGISALDAKSKSVKSVRVYEDPVLFITPTDPYDEESGPAIDIEETLTANYLFTDHHPAFWEELLLSLNKNVKGIRTMKVTQAHIAKRFVQEGLGVSFLPHSIVRRELIEGKLMQPYFDLFDLPSVFTYVLFKTKGEIEEEFLEALASHYFGG